MMKDIEIKISRETRMVDLSKTTIGNDGENLQGNLVFSFTDGFVKGQGRLEYIINGESKYAFLLNGDENYYIPIKSVMTKEGQIDMQLVITEGTDVNEIPIFKSNVFYVSCKKSINAEIEEEEGYYSWIEIANTKLNEVDEAIEELASQSNYAKEQGDYAKEQGTNAKNVADDTQKKAQEGAFDGKSLEFVWEGTKLGVRLEGQEEYHFVDLQGKQGEIGATGEPFKIKKTYASVSEMNADFRNMEFGDYVMIASSVEVEDNAKLYTRGESAWIFISDFSGAMGIRGETGLTPNIKIGEVKTLEAGSQAKVTRSGSNEEPVLNFEIPKGDKGDNYVLTEEDKVEIGKKVNTEYEERIEQNEKYISELEATIDILTNTNTAKGELVHITDGLPLPTFENKVDGNAKQFTTTGTNLCDLNVTQNDKVVYNSDGTITINGSGGFTLAFKQFTAKANTKYYIKWELVSGTVDTSKSNGNSFLNPFDNTNIKQDEFKENVIENDKNISGFWINNMAVFTNAVIRIWFSETQIPFEPYTGGQASPNPSYPQEIEVIEGNVGVRVIGEQLYNCKDINDYSTYLEIGEEDWITITYDNSSGTAIKYINVWTNSLNLKENTKYNILCEIKNISGSGVFLPISQNTTATQNQGQFVKQYAYNFKDLTNNSVKQIIETTKEDFTNNLYGLRTFVQFNAGESGSITFRISVIEDTTITANNFVYKPYKEQIVPLDLKGNWVGKINDNIKDYLVTDKKKFWLVKNVGKAVLDGNSTITKRNDGDGSTTMSFNVIPKEKYKVDTPCICNRFINDDSLGSYSSSEVIGVPNNTSGIYITILRSRLSSSDENGFKQWLNENNTEVYYVTNKTEIIELGELPEPIKTFEGVNNIQLLANLDTEIEVTYALDVKKYFENKLASIQEQIL